MMATDQTYPTRPRGPLFTIRRESVVDRPRCDVFEFFADAHNLNRVTPPFLRFRILTPPPIHMAVGTRIDYALRVHGLPLRWQSEIAVWEPPHRFVDMQIRGPYRWWYHEHRFEDAGDSTRVIDEVEYAVLGGRLMHALFVRRDLRRIFDYRERALTTIFANGNDAQVLQATDVDSPRRSEVEAV